MKRISLDSLCAGELDERLQMAFAQIAANCLDLNTDYKTKRKLTLTMEFAPNDESRRSLSVTSQVKVHMAPAKKASTTFLLGQDLRTGAIEMREYGSIEPPAAHIDKVVGEIQGEEVRKEPIDLRKK